MGSLWFDRFVKHCLSPPADIWSFPCSATVCHFCHRVFFPCHFDFGYCSNAEALTWSPPREVPLSETSLYIHPPRLCECFQQRHCILTAASAAIRIHWSVAAPADQEEFFSMFLRQKWIQRLTSVLEWPHADHFGFCWTGWILIRLSPAFVLLLMTTALVDQNYVCRKQIAVLVTESLISVDSCTVRIGWSVAHSSQRTLLQVKFTRLEI